MYRPWSADPFPDPPDDAESRVYRRHVGGDLRCHLWRPVPALFPGPRPAVVFFFGGGWRSGHPMQFTAFCRHLAERGMVAISAEYRTASRVGPGFSRWMAIGDGQAAVAWVRSHARDLGVDPNRVAAGGGSAGGHVAACSAVLTCPAPFTITAPHRPDALLLFNPVIDTSPEGYGYDPALGALNLATSPLHNRRPGVPPTLIQSGDADTTTPIGGQRAFIAGARADGDRAALEEVPGAGHGFFNWWLDREPEPGPRWVAAVERLDRFLVDLGWIAGPFEVRKP